jgi:RNA polymerase sigma factor (TIGR02999 family)
VLGAEIPQRILERAHILEISDHQGQGCLEMPLQQRHIRRKQRAELGGDREKLLIKALARERQSHQTLQPTALVHEAYLRVSREPKQWDGRGHFFAAAARAMRRILVERARHYGRIKHGAGGEHVELDDAMARADPGLTDVIAIDEALAQLELTHPRTAQVVTLRYFAGLSVEETASAMDLSPATVKNECAFARAWLFRKLDAPRTPPSDQSV